MKCNAKSANPFKVGKTNFIQVSNYSKLLHTMRRENQKWSRGGSNPRPSHYFSTPAVPASTVYKYDALTDCATGAG